MQSVTVKDILETLAMFSNELTVDSFKCIINAPNVKYNICIDENGNISSFEDK